MEIKLNTANLLLILMLVGLIVFGIVHSCNPDSTSTPSPVYVDKPVQTDIPPDTTARPVNTIIREVVDSAAIRFWMNRYDSLSAIIAAERRDTVQNKGSTFEQFFTPRQIVVEDTTSINYVTIRPLDPMGTYATVDSTRYKNYNFTALIPITREDCLPFIDEEKTSLKTLASVGVGAAAGAQLGGPLGAAAGAIAGLVYDRIF